MADPGAVAAQLGTAAVRLSLEEVRFPPREEFLIGSMIPLAKSSVVYGPSGVGKSAAAAQLALAIAAGEEKLWGLPLLVGGGPVLVFSAEDSLDDWRRKAAAVLQVGGIDVRRALERLYIIDQSEGVARLSEVVTIRSEAPEGYITRHEGRPAEQQQRLIDSARAVGATLILVETASRLVEDEDNANFAALQSALGRVGRETGAAVLTTHHPTKAASKDGDSSIESARGGGAFVNNARNALSLFPADAEAAKPYAGRFAAEDIVVLGHGKSTSSTRRQPPITLVRCDATWGAVFCLPDDVSMTPEQERANAERLEQEHEREWAQLRQLYKVVEEALPIRPTLSPSWLRDNRHKELGVPARHVETLVGLAVDRGILRVGRRTERGVTVVLGVDPRRPVGDSTSPRPSPSESVED